MVQIRNTQVKDAPELNRILFRLMCRFEKMDSFDSQDRKHWKCRNTGIIRKVIKSRDKRFIVAEEGKKIVGLIEIAITKREGIFRIKGCGHIETMFIEPEFRGKGYGKLLVKSATDWFKSKKAGYVTVGTHALDEKANLFWKKMGFNVYNIKYRKKV